MRRWMGLLVVVMVTGLAACSLQEPMAVEFSYSQDHSDMAFSALGVAVDEAALCAGGMREIPNLESVDGAEITDDDWADMFDAAMAKGGIAEMNVLQEFVCHDQTGAFVVKFHNRIDFATFGFEGEQDVGTWEIVSGTDSYAELSGSGAVALDWGAGRAMFRGEVQRD